MCNFQTGRRWREKQRGSNSATTRRCSKGWRRRSVSAPAAANSRSTSLRARPSSAALSECKAAAPGSPTRCVDGATHDFRSIPETASHQLRTLESGVTSIGGGHLLLYSHPVAAKCEGLHQPAGAWTPPREVDNSQQEKYSRAHSLPSPHMSAAS